MGRQNMLAPPPQRPWKIHPIWRGIGCVMVLIAPVLAYAGAVVLLDLNAEFGWVNIPAELLRTQRIPGLEITLERTLATLILAGGLLLLGFSLIVILYGMIYSFLGPPRYGPMDADPHKDVPRRASRR